MPRAELRARHDRCRSLLRTRLPDAGGLLVSGYPAIYYFTGTMAAGIFWLPLEGEPVLAVRKAMDRAAMESPLENRVSYRSFKELPALFAEAGSPLPDTVAIDKVGISWEQGELLASRLPVRTFLAGDDVIGRTRTIKSPWELAKVREAGKRHHQSLRRQLPACIRPGMTEMDVARALWDIFFSLDHCGALPAGMPGAGVFLGNVTAGENGNYPTAYNGPLGLEGAHPASPLMASQVTRWKKGEVLLIDTGFSFEGYLTDKTDTYFAGCREDIPPLIQRAQDVTEAIEAQCANLLKPGAIPATIYAESLRMAEEAGFAEGYMGLGGNKVPFLGHGIGLTISEWPIIARGFTEPLQCGMTIALEPKIGLPGIGMVGTENTYEITENGPFCLTGEDRGIICVETDAV